MSTTKSKSAEALRAAGYAQIPRWWATLDQIELIEWMVKPNLPDICRIKQEARDDKSAGIDDAWRIHNKETY
jgi:hypothetical protein